MVRDRAATVHFTVSLCAACLEDGLSQENQRVEGIASEWSTTKATLDVMVLDGTFDVVCFTHTHTHTQKKNEQINMSGTAFVVPGLYLVWQAHVCAYIYTGVCVCVCVCACQMLYIQARMKRELQGFKDMFEELGKLASRGQILTVRADNTQIDSPPFYVKNNT